MGRASSARIDGGRNARYTRPFFCTSLLVFLLGEAYCSCRRYTDVLISTLEEQKEGAHIGGAVTVLGKQIWINVQATRPASELTFRVVFSVGINVTIVWLSAFS